MILALLLTLITGCASHRREDVRFRNGEVTLFGSLFVPAGEGPHPAIVFIHGDGPDTRDGYRFFAELFASRGVAALIYDKRGAGDSSGDWRRSRFSELAEDALAGVHLLRGRTDINAWRIGLWGGSQGGWIAPLAASRSKDVAFVITKAGPVMGPARLATYKSVTRVRRAGFPPGVADRVKALMETQFGILRTGGGWDELAAEVEKVKNEPWYRHVAVMRHSPWESSWMGYGKDIDFDPEPIFEKLDVPVLSLLGELDEETPVQETAATLERIKKEGGKDFTVIVFRGADHQIELPRRTKNKPRFAPGYLEAMVDWTVGKALAGNGAAK